MGGPLYKTYDQEALNTQYNNRARVTNYMDYLEKTDLSGNHLGHGMGN